MDSRLEHRLTLWHKQIEKIRELETAYLELKASEKALYSEMFLKTHGKNLAEREALVRCSDEWEMFMKGRIEAESAYNHAMRQLELKKQAFQAEYLSLKIEADGVR